MVKREIAPKWGSARCGSVQSVIRRDATNYLSGSPGEGRGSVNQVPVRPSACWPELFKGLSIKEVKAVDQAVVNNVLEGWNPTRKEVAKIVSVVRGEVTKEEFWDDLIRNRSSVVRR